MRQRALAKLFGSGASGAAVASIAGWLFDQARAALRKEPQRLDVSRLQPGETYLVTTRPAMSRTEAKLDASSRKLAVKVERDARPRRSARRARRRLESSQRKLDRTTPGTTRAVALARSVEECTARLERRSALSSAQRRRAARYAAMQDALAAERARVEGKARRKARPARTRRFR